MALSSSDDIISGLRKQFGLDENTKTVLEIWDKEFAPMFNYAELIGLNNGHLVIEVLSSVHFQELALRRNEIVTRLNQYLGKDKTVQGIKIKLKS